MSFLGASLYIIEDRDRIATALYNCSHGCDYAALLYLAYELGKQQFSGVLAHITESGCCMCKL